MYLAFAAVATRLAETTCTLSSRIVDDGPLGADAEHPLGMAL